MLTQMSQLLLPMEIRLGLIQIDKLISKIKINSHKATTIYSKIK